VPFIDDLLDRLGLELGGIFRSLHLHGFFSVLTSLFVYWFGGMPLMKLKPNEIKSLDSVAPQSSTGFSSLS
jgi:hypothetical protein